MQKADAEFDGRVVDENGNPLKGIRVMGWGCGTINSEFTDENGVFHFEGLVPGEDLTIRACGVDYGPMSLQGIPLSAAPLTIQFPGKSNRSLKVNVKGGNGRPAPGAMIRLVGNHYVNLSATDPSGVLTLTRCPPVELYVEAMQREPNQSYNVWLVPSNADEIVIAFPSEEERQKLLEERDAREANVHPMGQQVRVAGHGWLTNPANVGPLPIENGVWQMRGIKNVGLKFKIPSDDAYSIRWRARRVCEDVVPEVEISCGNASERITLLSFEWEAYEASLALESGERLVQFQLKTGWAVDLDWVVVAGQREARAPNRGP